MLFFFSLTAAIMMLSSSHFGYVYFHRPESSMAFLHLCFKKNVSYFEPLLIQFDQTCIVLNVVYNCKTGSLIIQTSFSEYQERRIRGDARDVSLPKSSHTKLTLAII